MTHQASALSKYILRHDMISFMMDGRPQPHMIRSDHPRFDEIVNAVKQMDMTKVSELMDPLIAFISKPGSRLHIIDGSMYFDDIEVHTSLSNKIVEMIKRNEDPQKFLLFMENLLKNPEPRAILEVYGFIESNTLPITSDGCLLAYKTVRRSFYDHFSNTILYVPGSSPQMPREDVNNDPEKTCATGLHVCSINYIKNSFFGGNNRSRLVLVKVNPSDIVSVPIDYENSKVRCCKMTVIAEFNVNTGSELSAVDSAIHNNLDRLMNRIKLTEAELREIIGMRVEENHLALFGEVGERMRFTRRGKIKKGNLFDVIKPTEQASIIIDRLDDRLINYANTFYKFNSIYGIKITGVNYKIKNKQNISLNNRLIFIKFQSLFLGNNEITEQDIPRILADHGNRELTTPSERLTLTVKLYVVDENDVQFPEKDTVNLEEFKCDDYIEE